MAPDLPAGIVLRLLIAFFRRLGLSIGTHPFRYLSISLTCSLILVSGIFWIQIKDDVRAGYSAEGSRSVKENAIYCEFFNCTPSKMYATTIVGIAKDGGSMVRESHLEELLVTIDFALSNVTTTLNGFPFSLGNLTNYAASNLRVLGVFLDGLKEQNRRLASGQGVNPDIILDYPYSSYYGHKFMVTRELYGVNKTSRYDPNQPTRLDNVWMVCAWFLLELNEVRFRDELRNIELRLFDLLTDSNFSDIVSYEVYGDEIINREVLRGAEGSFKYFIAGFLLMLTFVTITVVEWKHGWRALNGMNVMLVGTSILSPLLAAGSVLGVMSALAIPMTSMMCLMPFLLLGIGVDDAFLMIHSWRKLRDNRRELTRAEHLSLTLADVGPSITITSLTNTLAFCIGSFSPMPQIRSFCICTALALLADFVLEIAFFGAVVVVSSSEEHQPAPVDEKPKKKPDASLAVSINAIREEVLRLYIKVITSWPARITAAAFLIVLWTISAMGVAKLQSAFWPGKTFQARSRLVSSMAIVDRMYYDHEITLILVNRPPQVDNDTEYQHFMSSIKQFQSMSNACGPNMTSLWLTDYAAFDNEAHDTAALFGMDSDHHLTYANVPEFLKSYAQYQGVVHWSHDSRKEVRVDGFAMWLCTTRMRSWYDRAQTLMEYRKIIDQYPTFNMTTFLFDASIFDLILSTGDVTIMAVIVTLISMAIVCLLFIPSLGCVLIATVTIGSIILAVVGSLSWWDCDMDVIAMVDILMAIGFTIDFTAHIIFHYCKSGANINSHSSSTTLKQPSSDVPKEERLYVTLSAISYPMFQAGFSTWLIVAPFFLYDVYMYRTFVKTITLTVGFGMIHGLILLPIALACLPNRFTSARVDSNSAPNLKPEVTFEELQSLAADT